MKGGIDKEKYIDLLKIIEDLEKALNNYKACLLEQPNLPNKDECLQKYGENITTFREEFYAGFNNELLQGEPDKDLLNIKSYFDNLLEEEVLKNINIDKNYIPGPGVLNFTKLDQIIYELEKFYTEYADKLHFYKFEGNPKYANKYDYTYLPLKEKFLKLCEQIPEKKKIGEIEENTEEGEITTGGVEENAEKSEEEKYMCGQHSKFIEITTKIENLPSIMEKKGEKIYAEQERHRKEKDAEQERQRKEKDAEHEIQNQPKLKGIISNLEKLYNRYYTEGFVIKYNTGDVSNASRMGGYNVYTGVDFDVYEYIDDYNKTYLEYKNEFMALCPTNSCKQYSQFNNITKKIDKLHVNFNLEIGKQKLINKEIEDYRKKHK